MTDSSPIPHRKLGTLNDLKREHADLLQRMKKAAAELSVSERLHCVSERAAKDPDEPAVSSPECVTLEPLLDDVDIFLNTLSTLSADPGTVENYLWICDTAVNWEHRLSGTLNVSRTVPLAHAPTDLLPSLAPGDALSETELDSRVTSLGKSSLCISVAKGASPQGCARPNRLG